MVNSDKKDKNRDVDIDVELERLAKMVEDAVEPNIHEKDKRKIKSLSDEVEVRFSYNEESKYQIKKEDTKSASSEIAEPEIKKELEKGIRLEKDTDIKKDDLDGFKEIKVSGIKDKNRVAQITIEKLRSSVQEIEEEVDKVVEEVKDKIARFESYEASVLNRVIAKAKSRLQDMGFQGLKDEVLLPKSEIKKDSKPLSINDISSGVGESLVLGIVGGVTTFFGWCIYISKVSGMPFPPRSFPTLEKMKEKALTVATNLEIGNPPTPEIGAGIVVGSSLLVTVLIYKILVSLKASKNLEVVKKLEGDTKEYCKSRLEFKDMIRKIGEHVDELKETTQKFEVILDEKSGSLRRAKVIEKPSTFEDLEEVTKETAKSTHFLIAELERLLASPMAKNSVLNDKSITALNSAKNLIEKEINKIYNRA